MKLYPWEYTIYGGSRFKQWGFGPVSKKDLSQRDSHRVTINGIEVHSLIFETASCGIGSYARWDCINGWTTTIKAAKKNFPNGLHGKPNKHNTGEYKNV